MKKSRYMRFIACLLTLVLLCGTLMVTACAAEAAAVSQEAAAEDPGMLPVILGAVFAFVVGNLLIARSRKKQQKKED